MRKIRGTESVLGLWRCGRGEITREKYEGVGDLVLGRGERGFKWGFDLRWRVRGRFVSLSP